MVRDVGSFLRKYFCEGQNLSESVSRRFEARDGADFFEGVLIPMALFHSFYWPLFFRYQFFTLLPSRFPLALVMLRGATTEGGGAVAFPVMTLAMGISPSVARDFSLMVQSCGLSSASFAIFFMGVRVERHSLVFSSVGAVPGLLLSFHFLDPLLDAAHKKMTFVAFFSSFALALFFLNSKRKRLTFDFIQSFSVCKALLLVFNGFVGGVFTGLTGSGLDVYSFSVLTLLFRISEKVATPTSVVLMALNSLIAFFWRGAILSDIQQYFALSVVVVVTFAPLGSLASSHFHRQTLAVLIYILESVALVGALYVVTLIVVAFSFYSILAWIGSRLMEKQSSGEPSSTLLPSQENEVAVQ